jgi:hypothetical protein
MTERSRWWSSAATALLLLVGCGGTEMSTFGSEDEAAGGANAEVAYGDEVPAGAVASPLASAGKRYDEGVYRATHNSYSGGARGTLMTQLDGGVRFLELDVHDNDFVKVGDYRVGHDSPGNQLDQTGNNPRTAELRAWLRLTALWSRTHAAAAPITLALDLKDDLTDNPSYAAGNLAALNDTLSEELGSTLFPADLQLSGDGTAPWPTIDAMRGRIVVVFSGHEGTRAAYRSDRGSNPAVAVNNLGQVVEVNDDGSGSLWYWTGTRQADGTIFWGRHGRYDSGLDPAIALNDAGRVIEVHKSQTRDQIWYHVGQLGSDGEITWGPSVSLEAGVEPSVRFSSPSGDAFVERHRKSSGGALREWTGSINASGTSVQSSLLTNTTNARFAESTQTATGGTVTVSQGTDRMLRYATDGGVGGRIAYRQLAFVELQKGNASNLQNDQLRFVASAAGDNWAPSQRGPRILVRQWQISSASQAVSPPSQFQATDTPFANWYLTLTAAADQ